MRPGPGVNMTAQVPVMHEQPEIQIQEMPRTRDSVGFLVDHLAVAQSHSSRRGSMQIPVLVLLNSNCVVRW